MSTFIATVCFLIILAWAFVVPALFKKSRFQESGGFDDSNTKIARERLNELKRRLENNELSQKEFELDKQELENTLALDLSMSSDDSQQITEQNSIPVALMLFVAVPAMSIFLYMELGRFDAVDGSAMVQSNQQQHQQPVEESPQMSMQDAVARLAIRLQNEPDNAEGWFMLAKTYVTLQRYDEAVAAYKKTTELVPDNANVLIRYADTLAMSKKGSLAGEAREAIEKALIIEPDNQQGLWLAGMAAVEAKEFKAALKRFLILRPMLVNPEYVSQIDNLIAKTKQKLTANEIVTVARAVADELASKPQIEVDVGIEVSVSLGDSIKSMVSSNDVVFIYAKAVSGPPMPLAASKHSVADLPFTINLNDGMAIMPTMKLSNFDRVIVGAKISKTGVAGSAAGDLYGEVTNVEVMPGQKVSIIINKVKS